jgi:hypothetical protein
MPQHQYDPDCNRWVRRRPGARQTEYAGRRPLWLGLNDWRTRRVARIQHLVRNDSGQYLCGRPAPPRERLDFQLINPRYCKACLAKLARLSPETADAILLTH